MRNRSHLHQNKVFSERNDTLKQRILNTKKMGKVSTNCQGLQESDLEILLRERLLKYLITREKGNFLWMKENRTNLKYSIYNIVSSNGIVQFRYKIGDYRSLLADKGVLKFRLCDVEFSEKNQRKGILTGMMKIVEEFAPRFGYKVVQIECPNSLAIQSWGKKNGFKASTKDLWEKLI